MLKFLRASSPVFTFRFVLFIVNANGGGLGTRLVRTNEIVRLLVTSHTCNRKFCISTWVSQRFGGDVLQSILNVVTLVINVHVSPRNLTWFTRLSFLVRGWGLGMKTVYTVP